MSSPRAQENFSEDEVSEYNPDLSDFEFDPEEYIEIDTQPINFEYYGMMKDSGEKDWEKIFNRTNKLKKKKKKKKKERKKKKKRKKSRKKKRKRKVYSSSSDNDCYDESFTSSDESDVNQVIKRPKRKRRKKN